MMHFGKKYAKNTGRMGGKKAKMLNMIKTAFEIIYLETGKNPVDLLVRAIENSSPNEDTTRIVYGGVVYHVSVDVASAAQSGSCASLYCRRCKGIDVFKPADPRRGTCQGNPSGCQ